MLEVSQFKLHRSQSQQPDLKAIFIYQLMVDWFTILIDFYPTCCFQVWMFCLSSSCSDGPSHLCNLWPWAHFPARKKELEHKNIKNYSCLIHIFMWTVNNEPPDTPQWSLRELWQCRQPPHPPHSWTLGTWLLWLLGRLSSCSTSLMSVSEIILKLNKLTLYILFNQEYWNNQHQSFINTFTQPIKGSHTRTLV